MLLLKTAKLLTGLRLLVAGAAPIVASSAALLSVRSAAYLLGFTFGSIGITLWPIIATLIAISGIFATTTSQCDAYQAELRRIELANRAAEVAAIPLIKAWNIKYLAWSIANQNHEASRFCVNWGVEYYHTCPNGHIPPRVTGGFDLSLCRLESQPKCFGYSSPYSVPSPPYPVISYITRSNCTPMNCPNSKKVWLQTIWASQSEFATQTKSCFLIGYSYTILDGLKIEYNPFELNKTFLESRSMNPFSVSGNRFRNLKDNEWKNLETVQGWDKGYWAAEQTDVECRGWNPGWSRKVK